MILLTTLWNIPRFFELDTCYNNFNKTFNDSTTCVEDHDTVCSNISLCATELRQNLSYCRDYILIGNFILMVLVPLFLLSVLNGHIYLVLAKSSRRSNPLRSRRARRDQHIAAILITIVFMFGFCSIPRVSINLFEVRRNFLSKQNISV